MDHTKLDWLVATRVMGWRQHSRNTAWWVDAEVDNGHGPNAFRGTTSGVDSWSPSTLIKTAWQVRRHLCKNPRNFLLAYSAEKNEWLCQIWAPRRPSSELKVNKGGTAEHESECVAICLAALRAVGVSEEEIQEVMQ